MGRKPLLSDKTILEKFYVIDGLSYAMAARKYTKETGQKISSDTVSDVLHKMGVPPRDRLDYYKKK